MQQTPVPWLGGLDIVHSVISRDSVASQIPQLNHIPTLIIHGDNDLAYPVSKGQEIYDLISQGAQTKSKLVVIPGAPHFLNLTSVEAIQDPIERFLADVGLSREDAGVYGNEDFDLSAFTMQSADEFFFFWIRC